MANHGTKAERREQKKRKRMPVSGKHVFTLQRLAARQAVKNRSGQGAIARGPGRRGKHGRNSVRQVSRINKPRHGRTD